MKKKLSSWMRETAKKQKYRHHNRKSYIKGQNRKLKPNKRTENNCHTLEFVQTFPYVENGELNLVFMAS